jgi:hypothetical protein
MFQGGSMTGAQGEVEVKDMELGVREHYSLESSPGRVWREEWLPGRRPRECGRNKGQSSVRSCAGRKADTCKSTWIW